MPSYCQPALPTIDGPIFQKVGNQAAGLTSRPKTTDGAIPYDLIWLKGPNLSQSDSRACHRCFRGSR
jgi:hypothetical protein